MYRDNYDGEESQCHGGLFRDLLRGWAFFTIPSAAKEVCNSSGE